MGLIHFLQEFVSNPTATGAIAPSSPALAKEMVKDLGLEKAEAVLEYGPGTGAFTPYVLENLPPSCTFVAIELNPRFVEQFRARFPEVTLHNGSVADARRICDRYNIAMVDSIICGLPWAAFPQARQQLFMDEMMRVLKPGACFHT